MISMRSQTAGGLVSVDFRFVKYLLKTFLLLRTSHTPKLTRHDLTSIMRMHVFKRKGIKQDLLKSLSRM